MHLVAEAHPGFELDLSGSRALRDSDISSPWNMSSKPTEPESLLPSRRGG